MGLRIGEDVGGEYEGGGGVVMTEENRSSRVGLEKRTEGIVEWGSGRKPINGDVRGMRTRKKKEKRRKN